MFFSLLQYYYRVRPIFLGKLYKLLYANRRLRIGKNFQCHTFPKILRTGDATIVIGDNVLLRRHVELRAHGESNLSIGSQCRIDRGVRLLSANQAKLVICNGTRIGLYTVFNGGDSIYVGEKSLISGFVYLQTSMHNFSGSGNVQAQGYTHAPIVLEEDVWIGTHAVIFPGVELGTKSIVGSSSVVNKSFPMNSIVAGAPAKLIKNRN